MKIIQLVVIPDKNADEIYGLSNDGRVYVLIGGVWQLFATSLKNRKIRNS